MNLPLSKARATAIALATLIVTLRSSPAAADTEAFKGTYSKSTSGNQYVFVMIAPFTLEEELRMSLEPADAQAIRRRYRQSGLYRNDGSPTPLWTVDWYAHVVHPFSDGVHLVRGGPWAKSTSDEALGLFANGALLKTYEIRQLVDVPWILPRTSGHFEWRKSAQPDDAAAQFTVSTFDGSRFTFDARNGEIVSRRQPVRWSALSVLGVAGGFSWFRRRSRRSRS